MLTFNYSTIVHRIVTRRTQGQRNIRPPSLTNIRNFSQAFGINPNFTKIQRNKKEKKQIEKSLWVEMHGD